MSELYTTGELARLCGVTVRTVQYYDSRGVLVPSALTEGGRRLYSEQDLHRMKIICFLRSVGLPIDSIARLLKEKESQQVLTLILAEKKKELMSNLEEEKRQLSKIQELEALVSATENYSFESIADMADVMENNKKLTQMRMQLLIFGLFGEAFELTGALLWILKGIWWPFVFISIPVQIVIAVILVIMYWKRTNYICPECHCVFKPRFGDFFFSNHTLTTRKLTCICCGRRGFCVETYAKKENTPLKEKTNAEN